MPETASDPRRSPARVLWATLWLALAVFLVARATTRPSTRGVILDHLEFGRRLLAGDDVYGPWKSDPDAPIRPLHAPYPPSYGLLTIPFAVIADTLGDRAARCAWAILQVLMVALAAYFIRRLTAGRAPPRSENAWHVLWLLTFVLGARFIFRDMHGGGGNLINVGMCLIAFAMAERGRAVTAGALLGFSLATKPTQVWLLPVLLALGHHRTVLWTLASGALCVLLTAALQRLEIGPWLRWVEGSWALATQRDPWADPALEFPPFEWMNQSLRFGIARWFGDVPPEFAARVPGGVRPGLGLDAATVGWIAKGTGLALLGLVLIVGHVRRRAAAARGWAFAAALVLSVLLSPLSWKAHHVALLPAFVLMLQAVLWRRAWWLAVLLLCWAATVGFLGGDLIGDDVAEWFNSIYVVTAWDIVLLLIALGFGLAASTPGEHDDAALAGA